MIKSADNKQVKLVRSLAKKKYRDQAGLYVTEGIRAVEEALKYPDQVQDVYMSQSFSKDSTLPVTDPIVVEDQIFKSISRTVSPQGVLATVKILKRPINDLVPGSYVLADGIQDPGNLGTLIRTIDCLCFDGLILGPGTVDLYNDKVVRSTMGAIHRVGTYDLKSYKDLKDIGLAIYKADLDKDGIPAYEANLKKDFILIIGNEGAGISEEARGLSSRTIYIPIRESSESLNASIAAAIIIYESMRQRCL